MVRVGGQEVELEQSNVKIESSRVGKGKDDRELNVAVEKGQAKILAKGKDGRKEEYIVEAQERARIASEAQGGVVVGKLPIVLSEPSDQKIYQAKGGQAKVKFNWKAQKKLGQARLEVSYSRSFKNKIHSLPLKGSKELLFQPGVYYMESTGCRGLCSPQKK